MARIVHIHFPVVDFAVNLESRYQLLPVGLYYNRIIARSRSGLPATLHQGWRRRRVRIVRVCNISSHTSVFEFMLKSLYGERMTMEGFFESWKPDAVREGFGADGFFTDRCLLVEMAGRGRDADAEDEGDVE